MKRVKITLIAFFIFLIIFSAYALLNMEDKSEPSINPDAAEIGPVIKNAGSLNILVDPRIELLSAVQLNSGYIRLTTLNFDYLNDMKDTFKDYKSHTAVNAFKRLQSTSFSYDAPPTSMLFMSIPPMLEQKKDFDADIISRAGNEQSLKNFMQYLRKFCSGSDFTDFYERNIPLYQTLVDTVYNNIKEMNITKTLDDYYGMKVNSYNIILAPLFHNGGYGPRIKGENGLYDVYGILGPSDIISGQDGETLPDFSVDIICYLAWHEFSHSFVNPTTEKYADEINKYRDLYKNISEQMENQAYPKWEICVNEHIVRAVTTRLTYIYSGQAAGDQALVREKSQGFYYIEPLCDSLKFYEENRDTYPTFDSYYPELIKVFKTISEQSLTFDGPINMAFNFNNLDTVFIIPTNEEDKSTQEEISKYVGQIKNKFFPNAEIIQDKAAIDRDLGSYVIIAYGTMEGNLWLQKYKDTFPFQVNSDQITADKDYNERNLILISALPNPQNSNNPLVIYTAEQSEDIIDINSINHGITDYLIAKGGQEITSGYYIKDNDSWKFSE